MYARILGTLTLSDGPRTVTPRAPKQRQLLSLLLLHAGQVVTVDECVDELWADSPPHSAHSTLQTYVMQIRKTLRSAATATGTSAEMYLETRDRGYLLAVGAGQLDLHQFEKLVEQASLARIVGDHTRESELLHRALGLWSGKALADVTCGPLLRTRLSGLRETRLGALEQRIDADLRIGRHHRLIGELRVLTRQYPTYENLHAQLMIALSRSGRTADALEVFAGLRRTFSTELGLEPSARVRDLHADLLNSVPVRESVYLPGPDSTPVPLRTAG
ncbi:MULTISPECIES: BTAD domain-containing putative transcriptional regulator [Streptomyces]|uniref:SARP family transcriptional regulator n=1 Tax=Streptomyces bottropensis ATCC 25435 TaxID=1054862 RepID=M3EW06_9ACTN|nr:MULTISPECIES: BTAD domain-containing putative transcriptional regulator [Streptomyces]EMF53308.1 SARP family transcriptional regulator [Streptomyces bottropensis ATCC 25435]MZD17343.1 SARP family transcriptional regulator [Streptomyces sp. SID5476]